jgi:hypothetical protein
MASSQPAPASRKADRSRGATTAESRQTTDYSSLPFPPLVPPFHITTTTTASASRPASTSTTSRTCDDDVVGNDGNDDDSDSRPTKKRGGARGRKNYKTDERDRLIELVHNMAPLGPMNWQTIVNILNAEFDRGRDTLSVRTKVMAMYRAAMKKPTGRKERPAWAEMIIAAYDHIQQRAGSRLTGAPVHERNGYTDADLAEHDDELDGDEFDLDCDDGDDYAEGDDIVHDLDGFMEPCVDPDADGTGRERSSTAPTSSSSSSASSPVHRSRTTSPTPSTASRLRNATNVASSAATSSKAAAPSATTTSTMNSRSARRPRVHDPYAFLAVMFAQNAQMERNRQAERAFIEEQRAAERKEREDRLEADRSADREERRLFRMMFMKRNDQLDHEQ